MDVQLKISGRRIFLILAGLIFTARIFSQDLLITTDGDTLNCRITKITGDYIYFTFSHDNEVRNTLLPLSQVVYYKYKYFSYPGYAEETKTHGKDYPVFRAYIHAGWSYRTAKLADVPSGFEDYYKDLRSGYHYGGEAAYYFTENFGLGIKYNVLRTTNQMDDIYIDNNGTREYGKLIDNITIGFIGPLVGMRLLDKHKQNNFYINIALGYMYFKNEATVVNDFLLTGNTIGFAWVFGYDIRISPGWAIGLQFSALSGTLFEFRYSDATQVQTIKLEEGSYESLSHINLSAGICYSL